jgi:hypothetical protein
MRRGSLLLIGGLLLAATSQAATGGGWAGTQFLKLPRGARPVGMGGAYAAVASGADSILWNPAGMNQLRDLQATAGHLAYLDGIADDYLEIARPIYGLGAWGLGVNYLFARDQGYDNWGNQTLVFDDYSLAAQVALSVELADDLSVGGVYKIIDQDYARHHSMGSGFDLGAQWRNLWRQLDLGLTLSNFGTAIGLGDKQALQPFTVKAGAALHLTENWLLAADYENQPVDHFNKFHAGTELTVPAGPASLAARVGYTVGPEQDLGGLAGLAAGLGFGLGAWQVDYSYSPMGDLGTSHRISLTWSSWMN